MMHSALEGLLHNYNVNAQCSRRANKELECRFGAIVAAVLARGTAEEKVANVWWKYTAATVIPAMPQPHP